MLRIPLFPFYERAQRFLRILEGKKESELKSMWQNILELKGTPQDPANWQNPDEWITERLFNSDRSLAMEIWQKSGKIVNPRHIAGIQFLMNTYKLIDVINGFFKLTDRGNVFVSSKENEVTREIDVEEGCIFILYLVSLNNNSSRKTFLQDWEDYLKINSNYKKESIIKDSLRRRLANLKERKYLHRDGNSYQISDEGKRYLGSFDNNSFLIKENIDVSESLELGNQIEIYNNRQKQLLKEKLVAMHSYAFENLIKELLEEIGYDDVNVTSPTNDKGVDVTGIIENGITSVKEVVQVKKMTSNVQRSVLDSLRGSLHRFDAVKGTIITTSDFSKGAKDAAFEKGAAPITLINGEKLIELLIKHNVAIKKKQITTFTIDNDFFNTKPDEEEIE